MNVAFFGTARGIGTSANLTALAAGLMVYRRIPVQITETFPVPAGDGERSGRGTCADRPEAELCLIDCSRRPWPEAVWIAENCDRMIVNFSASNPKLEEVYLRLSLVRKDVIFLIGKYYQNQPNELEELARLYRLPRGSICAVPYNARFGRAYENGRVPEYFERQRRGAGSYEDETFHAALEQAMRAVLKQQSLL